MLARPSIRWEVCSPAACVLYVAIVAISGDDRIK